MRAIIMAGGLGTRLRPFTNALPKPLVPIGDQPVLSIILQQLAAHGFTHVTLAVGHLSELIQAYFGDGKKWGLKLDYTHEDRPLGTIGPLSRIPDLPEHFLVMNADLLTNLDFRALMTRHQQSGATATLATRTLTTQIEYGVLALADQTVSEFCEKPTLRHTVSLGIHALSREILTHVPVDQLYGLDHLIQTLLKSGDSVEVFPFEGYWLDIGRPGDYEQAVADFEQWRERLLPPAKPGFSVVQGSVPSSIGNLIPPARIRRLARNHPIIPG